MADTKVLSEEVAAKIGGGDCTVQDAITITGQLTAHMRTSSSSPPT
jgi:hypothetical protein